MTAISPAAAEPKPAALPRSTLHRAIWRRPLFAGLLSVPFMVLLAVRGSVYLFHDGMEHTAFSCRSVAAYPGTPPLPAGALLDRVMAAVPGSTATSSPEPADRTASAVATVEGPEDKTRVHLDPYTGRVLDRVRSDRAYAHLARKTHSLKAFGTHAERLIAAVAGFAMALVVTGIHLWRPRGRSGGIAIVRGTPRARLWWRDGHAVASHGLRRSEPTRLSSLICATAAVAALLPAVAHAADGITVTDALSRATPAGAPTGVGTMTITNAGDAADRLVSASSPAVDHVEIHEMAVKDGIMTMGPVLGGLPVPPHGSLVLKSGGYHLMLIKPKRPLKAGDVVPVTLTFEKAGATTVDLLVKPLGGVPPTVPQ